MKRWIILSAIAAMLSPLAHSQDLMFEDIAIQAGITAPVDGLNFGAAWADFDNDGDVDLFIATDPENNLYRNNGDGTFTDIAEEAGVADHEMVAMGAAWGDYNGDGWLDLYVANIGIEGEGHDHDHGSETSQVEEEHEHEDRPVNRLYRNNGDGTFTDVAHDAGVEGYPEEHHEHEAETLSLRAPAQEDEHDHDHAAESGGFTSAAWLDYDNDGALDLLVSSRTFGPVLYRNLGDGTFEYSSEEAGLLAEHDHEDEHAHEEGHAAQVEEPGHEDEHEYYPIEHAACGDFDNDGDIDLYLSIAVAHEEDGHDHESEAAPAQTEEEHEHAETENRFFVNNGDGTFTERTDESGLGEPNEASSNSAVWGDYDNDGDLDLFVGNIGSVNEGTAAPQHLYRNNGDGTFTDVFSESGMNEEYYLLGAAWGDINNDGWLDLLAINHPDHDDYPAGTLYPNPHPIFINNGDGTFTNINQSVDQAILDTGVVDINHIIALSIADMNNDGDLDFIMTENHGDGPTLLYENINAATGGSIQIRLQAQGGNGFAYGARVEATAGDLSMLRYAGFGDTGFASQSSGVIHFGVGDETSADIKVVWPDGTHELFGAIAAGEIVTLVQGDGTETSVSEWAVY